MRGICLGIALAVSALAAPAAAQQQQSVEYGPLQDLPPQEFPLSLTVTGWDYGFTQAFRQSGGRGTGEPFVTRYEGIFAHGAYFGRVVFVESQREVRWNTPAPRAALREFPYFKDKPSTFGRTGAVSNGRMTLDYVHVKLNEAEPKACALFTGSYERVQMRGYACAVQSEPFDAAEDLMRALGRRGLLDPIPATLPVIRAATGPGGQPIVPGAPFDARAVPFVSDATRARLATAYGNAPEPKALAIHPSGASTPMVGQATEKEAIRRALERCGFEARSACVLYAVGNRVVLQHDALPQESVSAAASSGTPRPPRGGSTPLTTQQLVAQLEKSTVLIVSTSRKGTSIGSGFFIAPDRLLTNRHVVEAADRILVTSRTLGRPYPAKVIAATDRGAAGSADYALLEVPDINHEVLPLSTQATKLQEVVAAGYPGITIGNDADFAAFARGQRNAAPDLVLTRGEVNALQTNRANVRTVVHTALISPGNSGGPLVDRCGRVVGINTYLIQQTTVTNFAIASSDLVDFLNRHGIRPPVNEAPCSG